MTHQIIQKWWVTPQETSMTYRAFDLFSIIGLAVLTNLSIYRIGFKIKR